LQALLSRPIKGTGTILHLISTKQRRKRNVTIFMISSSLGRWTRPSARRAKKKLKKNMGLWTGGKALLGTGAD